MNSFSRLIPYVWPHRKKLFLSVFFALFVAIFWGLNLSTAYPVVKVLLQGQNLDEYLDGEIARNEESIAVRKANLAELDQSADADVATLKKRSREQRKISAEARSIMMMKWTKQNIVRWLPDDRFDVLALILLVFLVGTVLKGICVFVQDVLILSVVELTVMSIRKDCFEKTLALDFQSLSHRGTPELMSRFTYDLNELGHGLRIMGGRVVREPLKAGACIVLALLINWQLTLLSCLFVPLAGGIFYKIGRKMKKASHRQMESMSKIYKTLEESFDSAKVVMAFNGAERQQERFSQENDEYYDKAMKIATIDSATSPITEVLGICAAFVALLPGAYLVLRGTTSIWGIRLSTGPMDVAQLSVLYVLLIGTIDPLRKLSKVYSKLKKASAATDRVFQLVDAKPLVEETETPKNLPRHKKTITFNEVSFAYTPKEGQELLRPNALEGVTLEVKNGEVIVVVGENGSGKSTLINLLPRFYDASKGQVLIDGVNIRHAAIKDLREQIGVVSQETILFDDTILANIWYGNPDASRTDIERVAKTAHVTQFLEQMPAGLETQVGEKGGNLSGGQRQRIALARAMLRNPAILLLDEATSAIDSQSEFLIHQSLREFAEDRTIFMVTHSVSQSILDFVSRIVVMDQGRMIAVGTHETLIDSCAVYQRLFRAQTNQRSA